ncbi:MAG: site-2 protease family protein, partial [Actinomyces sp.]|nr:site-2 protease family protein [Actinomyces sp.]
ASLNMALFVFNLIPLLPLDGGHIAGALFEGTRRMWARLRNRPDPGPVDTARMLPVTYAVMLILVVMTIVLVIADIVVPVTLPL